MGAAAVTGDAAALVFLSGVLAPAAVRAVAALDDDRDVRVALVVVDHLVVEVIDELAWNDAIDHAGSVLLSPGSGHARVTDPTPATYKGRDAETSRLCRLRCAHARTVRVRERTPRNGAAEATREPSRRGAT